MSALCGFLVLPGPATVAQGTVHAFETAPPPAPSLPWKRA